MNRLVWYIDTSGVILGIVACLVFLIVLGMALHTASIPFLRLIVELFVICSISRSLRPHLLPRFERHSDSLRFG